jgi:hypothetical protein
MKIRHGCGALVLAASVVGMSAGVSDAASVVSPHSAARGALASVGSARTVVSAASLAALGANGKDTTSVTPLSRAQCAALGTAAACKMTLTTSIKPVPGTSHVVNGTIHPASSATFYVYATACFGDAAVVDQPDNGVACSAEGFIEVQADIKVNLSTFTLGESWENCTQGSFDPIGLGWSIDAPALWCAYTGNGTTVFTVGGNWEATDAVGTNAEVELRLQNVYLDGELASVGYAYWNGA